jgi:hypothetical protein
MQTVLIDLIQVWKKYLKKSKADHFLWKIVRKDHIRTFPESLRTIRHSTYRLIQVITLKFSLITGIAKTKQKWSIKLD